MKFKTWIIVGIFVFGLVMLGCCFEFLSSGKHVEAGKVKIGDVREFVDERAKTRIPKTYLITMPQSGRIEPIKLQVGGVVKAGKVVAQMVPLDLQLSVDQAKAVVEKVDAEIKNNAESNIAFTAFVQADELANSVKELVKAAKAKIEAGRSQFDYSEKNLRRTQTLAVSGAKTQDQLDQAFTLNVTSRSNFRQDELIAAAMAAFDSAVELLPLMVKQYTGNKRLSEAVLKRERARAIASLERALEDQKRGTMRSPVNGVVLKRNICNQRFAQAGTVILEIGRFEDLEVESDMLSLDVVSVKVGNDVEVYGPAIGKQPVNAKVAKIYPAGFTKISSLGVEQQRVRVIAKFGEADLRRLIKTRHLGIGYRVRVKVFTAERHNVLTMPRSAMFRATNGQWQVFVIRNGRAALQNLQIGLTNAQRVEVIKGVKQGELVVIAPESNLVNGQKVKP